MIPRPAPSQHAALRRRRCQQYPTCAGEPAARAPRAARQPQQVRRRAARRAESHGPSGKCVCACINSRRAHLVPNTFAAPATSAMRHSLHRAGVAALAVACAAAQAGPTPDPAPAANCVLQGQGATYDLTSLSAETGFLIKNSRDTDDDGNGGGVGRQWCVCEARAERRRARAQRARARAHLGSPAAARSFAGSTTSPCATTYSRGRATAIRRSRKA